MTLRQRTLRAGAWTVASYTVDLSTRFLSNLILTRLLFPDAFGVIAAATTIIGGLQLVSDFGVRAAIIQNPHGEDAKFLRTAWLFQCVRGTLLWLALLIICMILSLPSVHSLLPTASVFAEPSFPLVTGVLGLSIILNGIESTATSLNVRRLNFRPIVALDFIAKIIPLPIMIIWAYAFPSVWSIVGGALTASVLRAILSHMIIPGPRMAFTSQREYLKEIVNFGKWISLSSFATFISSYSDIIILGLLLPSPLLGVYYIAKTLRDAIEFFLERLNSTMTLPVLGEVIRTKPENLKDRYYRFRLPIELVAASFAGFLFAAGDSVVHVLYDQRYSEAGLMLQILSFGLLVYPFQLIRSAFTAIGKTDVVAWISILQAACLAGGLSLGYYLFGPLGAIAGVASNRVIPSIITIILAHRANWISPWKELRWIPTYAIGYLIGKASVTALAFLSFSSLQQLFNISVDG
jgi:O-antigen/teichoic acid export membrane protein